MKKDKMNLVDKLLRISPDPLGVRKSTAEVFLNLNLIDIDFKKIDEIAKIITEKVDKKQLLTEEQFGSMEPSPQLIFILDAINFCFWAKKDQEKWTVEYPAGNFVSNGWFGLVSAIERARQEGIPILEPSYLKELSISEAEYIFRSSNSTEMPLLEKRVKFLNEIGKILESKYNGNIYNLLASTGTDVGKIATEVVKNFPSFTDSSVVNNKKVNFYKRAQIFAYDVSFLPALKLKNLNSLTAFADYKIPQILRAFGITNYHSSLTEKVDNYILLKKDSREEIEIRSTTIWVCELLAAKAGIKPVLVDNVLWKMSQSLKDVKPYHRVLTTAY